MANTETTTIRISNKNKVILEQLKIHHRETYNDVLERLFKND